MDLYLYTIKNLFLLRPDSYILSFYLFGTLLITGFSVVLVIFFIIQKKRQVQNFLEQQKLKFDYEHSLLTTRIEVQEQAFEFVSRDIHDNIGQVLSLGCIQLASLKNTIDSNEVVLKLDDTLQLFKKSVKDLRLLSHSLNTGLVQHRPLEQSVKTELDRIEAFSNIDCEVYVPNGEEGLPPDQRLVVFRIVQEALQNILKHAEATKIRILLEQLDTTFNVQVTDNGIGFEQVTGQAVQSMGLLSMQQRATLMRARLTVSSLPGKGTEVNLEIPITAPVI